MEQNYHLQNIRTLLLEGFSAEELRRLCYDHSDFRQVYHELSTGMGKADIIDRLIEHTNQALLMDKLLTLVRGLNPARYDRHKPYTLSASQSTSTSSLTKDKNPASGPKPDNSFSSFLTIKRQTLEKRLTGLINDYQAVNNQLDSTLDEMARTRLKRQITALEQEIQQVESELNVLT